MSERMVFSEINPEVKNPLLAVNVLERLGLPLEQLQQVPEGELTPERAIIIDRRALTKPECPPIIFGVPHAGEYVPQDLFQRATSEGRKTLVLIDRGTNAVFKSEKIASVRTLMSRFVVDPNRPPLVEQSSVAPGSITWLRTIEGLPMYESGKEPTGEEIRKLTHEYYVAYYKACMSVVGTVLDRRKDTTMQSKERTLFADGHSFPNTDIPKFSDYLKKPPYNIENPGELPLFIIGDKDGAACDEDIREAFARALEHRFSLLPESDQGALRKNIGGEIVRLNHPFKGVRNVDYWGKTQGGGLHALQLEINEAAYVDEPDSDYYSGRYDTVRMELVRKLIEAATLEVAPMLRGDSV